jgi:hypothetical protein
MVAPMRHTWPLLLALAACSPDARQIVDAKKADAPVDVPVDGAGSGSNMAAMEPSPHDYGLELVVVVASMVVVVGPVRSSRRRREHDDDGDDATRGT